MRQRVVWFVLGVLIGSLFVVSAYPNDKGVQYGVPAVQEIAGKNYTAYIFYSKSGLPIDKGELVKKIGTLLNATAPNAKWQAYAIPELPKDVVLIGYGIKVAADGRTESYILATKRNFLPQKNSKTELLDWAKEKPIFTPKIPIGTYGPPKGWEVKISSSNGEERVLSGQVSPYWYDIGPAEMKLNYPPYGDVYMKFHLYALIHDGDPQHVSFLLAPGKDTYSGGRYEIDPGYGNRYVVGNNNYGDYVTDTAKIIHDWNLDPALEPEIDTAYIPGNMRGHREIQVTLGYPPSLSFTVTIPDSYMFPAVDRSTQKAGWLLEFNTYSGDAMYAFYTNVYSTAKVKQSVILDGTWHPVVRVQFWASFIKQGDYEHTHKAMMTLTWNLKVG